jgi:hypothetical protein
MPLDPKLVAAFTKQYGPKKGMSILYAMENAGRGPFAKGKEYAAQHVAFVKKHRAKATNVGSFNSKHPRVPKGSHLGGKFRRK